MPGKSALSKVSRRRLPAVPGGATASSLAGRSGPTPVPVPGLSYVVTMEVTPSGSIIYTTNNVPLPNNALNVKLGDSVQWQAKTATPQHRWAILFPPNQTPFGDNGNLVYAFQGSQANEPTGGTIVDSSPGPVNYKYFVAVVDDSPGGKIYTDDPKIIVGNAVVKGKLIVEAEDEAREAARLNAALSEKIDSIEKKLNKLIRESR